MRTGERSSFARAGRQGEHGVGGGKMVSRYGQWEASSRAH